MLGKRELDGGGLDHDSLYQQLRKGGLYEYPGEETSVSHARSYFIRNLSRYTPKVAQDLSEEPFRRYLESGISKIDSFRLHHLKSRPYSVDIWLNLREHLFNCQFFPSSSFGKRPAWRPSFIHHACAARFKRETQNLIAQKIIFPEDKFSWIGNPEHAYYSPCPQLLALWESLIEWAWRNNLVEKRAPWWHFSEEESWWCVGSGFRTLCWWGIDSDNHKTMTLLEEYEEGGWGNPWPISGAESDLPKPPTGFVEWRADWENRESYLNGVTKEIERQTEHVAIFKNGRLAREVLKSALDQAEMYCDRVEEFCVANGFSIVPERPKLLKHLDWAIRFQIKRETYSDIATASDVSVSTVKRAVEKTLALIGLTKRSDAKPGFPRGKKHSRPGSAHVLKQLGR